MNPVDREGTFKADITDFGLKEMESGAVAVSIKAKLVAIWDAGNEGWHKWDDYEQEAEGDLWVVKKDGTLNGNAVKSLMEHAGWDGNMESIANQTWQPTQCQVVVVADTYEGKTRYKISFVNAIDRKPGGLSNVNESKARELQAKYGGQLRAIGGNLKRNVTMAPGKPCPPPPAPTRMPLNNAPLSAVPPEGDIPF